MKLLIVFSFFIVSCGQSAKSPANKEPTATACLENYIILENLADQNKPIPLLVFYDSLVTPKEFPYARNFALNRQALCEISEGVKMYSDTWLKQHALYRISLTGNDGEHVKFVNTDMQLKDLFDYLEAVLKGKNLYQPFKAVYDIRQRLLIPH